MRPPLGYWQTEIDERDRDKTAFVTRKGQWRFKVLSFGLANAPSQFARIMELVMSGLTYHVCLVYLDDILVFSKTFDDHLERLATVFDRLDRYSLKLKPSKCSLFQRKISFLGHVVSGNGIECDPEKVAAIALWPTTTSIPEVCTFCGLASYYRTFVTSLPRLDLCITLREKGQSLIGLPNVRLHFRNSSKLLCLHLS